MPDIPMEGGNRDLPPVAGPSGAFDKIDFPTQLLGVRHALGVASPLVEGLSERLQHLLVELDLLALIELPHDMSLPKRIEALERREITRALRACSGNITRAAQVLGISRKGLHDRMRRLDLRSSLEKKAPRG